MAIEVDFLAVGEESKSGDAITFRYGDLLGSRDNWVCGVVDGGTLDAGDRLCEFIQLRYGTTVVDLAFSTHPDGDHSSGLRRVLEDLDVRLLCVHRPWLRSKQVKAALDRAAGAKVLNERALASLDHVRELERIAEERGIPIHEPFTGSNLDDQRGKIVVLGPDEQYYEALLEEMDQTTAAAAPSTSPFSRLIEGGVGVLARLLESFHVETLKDPPDDAVSPSNNSSVILLIENEGDRVLLTADAGVPALERAEEYAWSIGIDLRTCGLQQVPHHGSKRNVGPTMLDVLVGERGKQQDHMSVYVSAAKKGRPKHPNVRVINAYLRRGAGAFSTEGVNICWGRGNRPGRSDYGPATPLDFFTGEVEEDDE